MNYEALKLASQIGTYTGLFGSSVLTWINLNYKTAHEPEAGHRKALTPAGKVYRALLVLFFAITIASAILQNVADAKLRKTAEEHGNRAIQDALKTQHQQYVKDLKEQFEGTNGVISQISKATDQLKSIGQSTKEIAGNAVDATTGGDSFPLTTPIPHSPGVEFMIRNNSTKYSFYDGVWEITYNPPLPYTQDALEFMSTFGAKPIELPVLAPQNYPYRTGLIGRFGHYTIVTRGRNGMFVQSLDVVKCEGGKMIALATTVKRGNKVLYRQVIPKTCIH